jgi:uncharacterized Zn-binding protein involved in type VI secretion
MMQLYSSPMFCQLPVPPAGPGHPPHPAPPGPALVGAPTVTVNGMPVVRKNDTGMIICCPCNFQFTVQEGSSSVEACSAAVSRMGDKVQHMADTGKTAKIILGMPVILTGNGGTDPSALQFPWYKGAQGGQANAARAPVVGDLGKKFEGAGSVEKMAAGAAGAAAAAAGASPAAAAAAAAAAAKETHTLELTLAHDSNLANAAGVKYQLEGPAGEKLSGTVGDDGKVSTNGKPGLWRIIIGGETYRSATLSPGGSQATVPVPTSLSDTALSKKRVYLGQTVDIEAKVRGVPDGKPAKIELYPEHAPDKQITSIDSKVQGGKVKGTWTAKLDKDTAHPEGTNVEIHVVIDHVEVHDVSVQTLHVDTSAIHFGF